MERKIMFLNEETAIDYESGNKKDKSLILAEVRKYKANKEIKRFDKHAGITGVKYEIKLTNGEELSISVSKDDMHSVIVLDTLMKAKKVFQDEVILSIEGEKVILLSRETGVRQGERDSKQIMAMLKSMHNNKELETVIKTGRKKFVYSVETKDNERLRIEVDPKDPLVEELDKFQKVVVRQNNIKQKLIKGAIITGAVAVIMATPYTRGKLVDTYKEAKETVVTYIQEEKAEEEATSNWAYLKSCALRLQMGDLPRSEYDSFADGVRELKSFYENHKTKEELENSIDYQTVLSWDKLVQDNYQRMMNIRVY